VVRECLGIVWHGVCLKGSVMRDQPTTLEGGMRKRHRKMLAVAADQINQRGCLSDNLYLSLEREAVRLYGCGTRAEVSVAIIMFGLTANN